MPNLITAIQSNKVENVKTVLQDGSTAVLDARVLQQAITSGNSEILHLISSHLKNYPDSLASILDEVTPAGSTVLHLAAKHCNYADFLSIVDLLGNERAAKQAKQINSDIELPIQVVFKNHAKMDRYNIRLALENLSMDKPARPLNKPTNFSKLLPPYQLQVAENPQLAEDLKRIAVAISFTRRIILKSSTHPSCRGLDNESFNHLERSCRHQTERNAILISNVSNENEEEDAYQKLADIVNQVRKTRFGTCFEFACLVAWAYIKMGGKSTLQIYEIKNGDHIFTVIGKEDGSDDNDFTKWGRNAAVGDGWKCTKGYPAALIPKKLKDVDTYNNDSTKKRNIVFPYDRKYQRLAPRGNFKFSAKFLASKNFTNLQEFAPDEVAELRRQNLVKLSPLESFTSNASTFFSNLTKSMFSSSPHNIQTPKLS